MELDPRIIEGKRPLTCFDTEQAKEFLGKECYFTNTYCTFEDLHRIPKSELQYISNDKDASDPYKTACYFYPFCLPCEWVEEEKKEPKYRPYTLAEFVNTYSLGDEVILKIKENNKIEHKLFIEYTEDAKNINTRMNICLGGFYYSLKDLFDKSELYTSEGWKPFGVEE